MAHSSRAIELSSVNLRFAGISALSSVSVAIEMDEIVAVVGPNGAGKSSLLNCISGLYRADSGNIAVLGHDVTKRPPEYIARLGVGRTFQHPELLFSDGTVFDNVMLGRHLRSRPGFWRDMLRLPSVVQLEAADRKIVDRSLDYLGLMEIRLERPTRLPYGTQKLVEFARALATEPKVMLLDEPSTGMSSGERGPLQDAIIGLRRDLGIATMVIEHDLAVVNAVASRVVVMDFGQIIAAGTFAEVMQAPQVRAAYLGEPATESLDEPVEHGTNTL
jgi:branched-chain amino acid transport system ATP-binding protein